MTDQQLPVAGQELRDRAIARLKEKRDFGVHLFVYLVVNSFLIGIWAFTGGASSGRRSRWASGASGWC